MGAVEITDEAVAKADDAWKKAYWTTASPGRNDWMRAALEAALPYLAPRPVVDRDALARAAHHHFCIRRDQPNHDPRQSDYDKADEILEILALLNGTES